MGRGIGTTQRAILTALDYHATEAERDDETGMSTGSIAAEVGCTPRQARAAVAALERRGMVAVRRHNEIGTRTDSRGELMPIVGTLVWSKAGWERRNRETKRMSGLLATRLPNGWDDMRDPREISPETQRRRDRETAWASLTLREQNDAWAQFTVTQRQRAQELRQQAERFEEMAHKPWAFYRIPPTGWDRPVGA